MNTTMKTVTQLGCKNLPLSHLAMVLVLPAVLIACSSDKKGTATTLNAPTLANAADQTYTVGTAIETLKFVNTGGDALTACTSAPALPMGLAVAVSPNTPNTATTGTERVVSCQITGTPTEVAAEATYMITGTNVTGMDAATVKITVEALAAPVLTTPAAAETFTVGTPLVGWELVNTGGQELTACVAKTELPAGLMVAPTTDKSTCEITGNPTTAAAVAPFVITATNATGSVDVTVMILIEAEAS